MKNTLKLSWKTEAFPIAIVIISWIASIYFYMHFPDRVPTHWNVRGEVDGWGSRAFGAFMLPGLNTAMYIGFLLFPFMDPKRDRYKDFAGVYSIFRSMIIGVMTAIYFIASLNGIGINVPVDIWVPAIIGILFIVLGNCMGKIRLNWMVGNRNMWTLSSEEVWNKTNRLSGKAFIVAGILIGIEGFIPQSLIVPTFIFAIALVLIVPTVYSFILYKKEQGKK